MLRAVCGNGECGFCSAKRILEGWIIRQRCSVYALVYPPILYRLNYFREPDISWYARYFAILAIHPIGALFLSLGILNYMIMTRVQKQLEGDGSAPLMLHQAEIRL